MNLPSISSVKLNPHRHYVTELRRRLPAYVFEPVPQRALWIIVYGAAAAAGIAVIAFARIPVYVALPVAAGIGLAFSALELLGHEIVHGAVIRRPWLRDLLASLCFLPVTISPMMWRLWHNLEHHGNTQVHDRDPDAYSTFDEYLRRPGLRLLHRIVPVRSIFFFVLLSAWFTVHSLTSLRRTLADRYPRPIKARVVAETAFGVAFWIALAWLMGWDRFAYAFVIPLLVNNFIVMSMIATNHLLNPLLEEDDPLAGSLSLRMPKFIDVIFSNFSHHTEHHVFPAMSARFLPQVRRLLKHLWPDRYHELPYLTALGLLWKTPRLYLDNVRVIDPATRQRYGVLGHGLDPQRAGPLE